MPRKKKEVENTTLDKKEVFEKFIRNYLIFDKRVRGIVAGEPPKGMVEAMAKNASENERFSNHIFNTISIMWGKTPDAMKTEEVITMYEELQKEIEDLK